jgi:hypothetical protein
MLPEAEIGRSLSLSLLYLARALTSLHITTLPLPVYPPPP